MDVYELRAIFTLINQATKGVAAGKKSLRDLERAAVKSDTRQTTSTKKRTTAQVAAVEKAHVRAIAMLGRERAAKERAHTQAINLLRREDLARKKAHGSWGQSLMKWKGIALGATLAVGLAFGGLVSSQLDFQTALNQVKAVTQATTEQMARMEAQALDLGATTKFTSTEAAQAQDYLARAGLSVQEVLQAMPGTLQLAAAGTLDLGRAADITTDVMSGYRLEISELPRINDALAATAARTNTNIEMLGSAMVYAAPVAAAAGIEFEQTSAALGLLATAGFKGEMGGTALRGAMTKLLVPSGKAEKILTKVGVSATTSTGQLKPLDNIIAQLETSGITTGEAMEVFGQRAGPGMLALVGQGSKALSALTDEIKASGGAAQRMADTQMEGLVGVWTEMKSAVDNLRLVLSKELTPAFTRFGESVRDTSRWLIENIDLVVKLGKGLVIATGAWVAYKVAILAAKTAQAAATKAATLWTTRSALAAGATTRLANGFTIAWKALMGPVGWVLAIGTATAALWKFWSAAQQADVKLPRLAKQIADVTARIEAQGQATPRQTTRLNKLTAEHQRLFAETAVLPPQLRLFELGIIGVSTALEGGSGGGLTKKTRDWTESIEDLSETVEWQSAKLGHWGLDISKLGKQVKLVKPPLHDLKGTIEGQSAALGHWGLDISNIGKTLDSELTGRVPNVRRAIQMLRGELETPLSEKFFASITGGFKDMIGGITGGKGITGMLTGIGQGITEGIGNMLSGGIASLANLALKGIGALGKKLWGKLKGLFGGPSEQELEGREAAAAFRQGIVDGLSPAQMEEARKAAANGAGSVTGAAVHIAVRDAEVAAGKTVAMAEATASSMVSALHQAEKLGPEAVAKVMGDIDTILGTSKEAAEEITADFDAFFTGVTAEQAPALTEAMIEMFGTARTEGALFAKEMQEVFDAVGASVSAYIAQLEAIPRDITTTVTVQEVRSPAAPAASGTFVRSPLPAGASPASLPSARSGTPGQRGAPPVYVQIDGETVARAVIEHGPETAAWLGDDR